MSPLHLFHIHKEGLKLRRLRVASPTNGVKVLAIKPFLATPHSPSESEYRWYRYLCRSLSAANTFGHHRFGFDIATVGGDFTVSPWAMPSLFASDSPISTTALAAKSRSTARVWSSSGSAGQTIGGSDIRELIGFTQCFASSLKIRAAGFEITFGCSGLFPAAFQTARSVPGTDLPPSYEGKQTPHAFLLHDKRPDAATGGAAL